MTRNDIILEGLKSRLISIDFIADNLNSESHDKRDYSSFYQEISYFLHYIIKTDELKKIFFELLAYFDKLKENDAYSKAIQSINSHVRTISSEMLSHSDFANFKSNHDYGFKNPFLRPLTLKVEDLLISLQSFEITPQGPLNSLLDDTFGVLVDIYNKWIFTHKLGFEKIINELNLLSSNINSISFFEDYEHDYFGVKSANNLVSIYKSLNPTLGLQGSTFVYLQNDLIHKGKGIFSDSTIVNLKNDCYKVYHHLQQRLTTQLSIEISIDRFATYMSLYFNGNIEGSRPEKALQNKFEEFIFQSGYYPISEAQVKDGRIDTLVIDNSNSFLCELKQADLGLTDESEAAIDDKLRGAQIQSSIYIDRLKTIPGLDKNVFIILFTNRKIYFKNNIDRVEKNGIKFIFKSIGIYGETPSVIKKDYELDIEKLIINGA